MSAGDAYLSKQGVFRIPPARRIIQQVKFEHGGGGLRPGWLPGSFERVMAWALRRYTSTPTWATDGHPGHAGCKATIAKPEPKSNLGCFSGAWSPSGHFLALGSWAGYDGDEGCEPRWARLQVVAAGSDSRDEV